jgi:bcr-type benzoyl-CoA reductase subunit B
MSAFGWLKYHANVSLLGEAFLRYFRFTQERKVRKPGGWKHPHTSPPLMTSPWLKELIIRHYLKGRHANDRGPVAWVTSGGPMEFLLALGFFVHYPENHAAVCAIRRTSEEMCVHAEDAGYSRDICSYARTDFGSVLSGKTPVGKLPRPDLLLACTNICQTVLMWYRVLAHHFKVPLIVIDTPFAYTEVTEHSVEYMKKQFFSALQVAERVAGKSFDFSQAREITLRAKEAVSLWLEIMEMGKHRPSPITAFDEFIHMAPIVEMRGERFTVDYYRAMLKELEQRVKDGVGAVKNEKKRILWDNLPIWHRIRRFSDLLAERGVAMVASTYTNAWGELAPLIDPDDPIESAARAYLHVILNRSTGHKLNVMRQMVKDYQADGVILHSDRSCKPYSIGQMDQRDRLARELGVPALLLEADHNDPRAFTDEQVENRLAAFMEVLGV